MDYKVKLFSFFSNRVVYPTCCTSMNDKYSRISVIWFCAFQSLCFAMFYLPYILGSLECAVHTYLSFNLKVIHSSLFTTLVPGMSKRMLTFLEWINKLQNFSLLQSFQSSRRKWSKCHSFIFRFHKHN